MYALITGFMEAGETPEGGHHARDQGRNQPATSTDLNLIGVYDFQRMNQIIIAYHARGHGEVQPVARTGRLQAVRAAKT